MKASYLDWLPVYLVEGMWPDGPIICCSDKHLQGEGLSLCVACELGCVCLCVRVGDGEGGCECVSGGVRTNPTIHTVKYL